MSRTTLNFWLDVCLLTIFVLLVWTSIIAQYVFPPGMRAAGWTLWGYNYAHWRDLQFGLLGAMCLAVLLHVMLHWNWVCGVVASRLRRGTDRQGKGKVDDGSRTLYGVGLLIFLLTAMGLGVAVARLAVKPPPENSRAANEKTSSPGERNLHSASLRQEA